MLLLGNACCHMLRISVRLNHLILTCRVFFVILMFNSLFLLCCWLLHTTYTDLHAYKGPNVIANAIVKLSGWCDWSAQTLLKNQLWAVSFGHGRCSEQETTPNPTTPMEPDVFIMPRNGQENISICWTLIINSYNQLMESESAKCNVPTPLFWAWSHQQ